jgi:biotin carboxyl carrier protein
MNYLATLEGAENELEVEEIDAGRYVIGIGGQKFEVDLRRVGPASFSAIVEGRSFDFEVHQEDDQMLVVSRDGSTRLSLTDRARRVAARGKPRHHEGGRAQLKAIMPGRVVNVLVAVGDEVEAGQGVLIIEAMKMENELKAPKAGKVVEVKVAAGQTVEKGDLLLVVE